MNPREQNIFSALNVLVLVWRANKQMYPNHTEEEQHTLRITKEHIAIAGLTSPVFINTLNEFSTKGYLVAMNVFEDKYHPQIQELLADETYDKVIAAFQKVDTSEFIEKTKIAIADALEQTVPANMHIYREEVLNEDLDIKTILDLGRTIYQGDTPDVVSTIILSPFRSIERLLEKMNSGTLFDNVKDAGVWYDPIAYELHFDDTTISTAYNNKPNKEHFALKALFSQFGELLIDYDDIPEFDSEHKSKEMKSYRDSLNRFLKKHPRLTDLFTVHADHLAIHETYLEHPH